MAFHSFAVSAQKQISIVGLATLVMNTTFRVVRCSCAGFLRAYYKELIGDCGIVGVFGSYLAGLCAVPVFLLSVWHFPAAYRAYWNSPFFQSGDLANGFQAVVGPGWLATFLDMTSDFVHTLGQATGELAELLAVLGILFGPASLAYGLVGFVMYYSSCVILLPVGIVTWCFRIRWFGYERFALRAIEIDRWRRLRTTRTDPINGIPTPRGR
jgi:hypothetical protein